MRIPGGSGNGAADPIRPPPPPPSAYGRTHWRLSQVTVSALGVIERFIVGAVHPNFQRL